MDHKTYLRELSQLDSEDDREALFKKAIAMENEDRAVFSKLRAPDEPPVSGEGFLDTLQMHPHQSLIPVFETEPSEFLVRTPSEKDGNSEFRIFANHDRDVGKSAVCPSLDDFRRVFLDVFCEGILKYVDWSNVFAAGGSVLACLQPLPPDVGSDVWKIRRHLQSKYPASDVDLFLYGLNEEQGREKIKQIYNAVRQACPCKLVCFRSSSAVTLVSQFPFRHIQIVLRLYSSPYEIIAGFDVDCSTVGFDGGQVYTGVRAHHSLTTCRNTVDLTRRSPSYEVRLAKYGMRGFEVQLDWLRRDIVDPGIYSKSWKEVKGLARLLMLEKLETKEERDALLGIVRPNQHRGVRNSWQAGPTAAGTVEMSDYSTVFLPWSQDKQFDADYCMQLMDRKDRALNQPFFLQRRGYYLHPCFFGTADEILEDCAPQDPPFPQDKPDMPPEHRDLYVRGKLGFITDNPGRQRIGSFFPLDEAGWTLGTFMDLESYAFFVHVSEDNATKVEERFARLQTQEEKEEFLSATDPFRRTPLALSITFGSARVMGILLREAPASMLARAIARRTNSFNLIQLCCFHDRPQQLTTLLTHLRSLGLEEGPLSLDAQCEPPYSFNALEMSFALRHMECACVLLELGWSAPRRAFHARYNAHPAAFLHPGDAKSGLARLFAQGSIKPGDRFIPLQGRRMEQGYNLVHTAIYTHRLDLLQASYELDPLGTADAANTICPETMLASIQVAYLQHAGIFKLLYSMPGIELNRTQKLIDQEVGRYMIPPQGRVSREFSRAYYATLGRLFTAELDLHPEFLVKARRHLHTFTQPALKSLAIGGNATLSGIGKGTRWTFDRLRKAFEEPMEEMWKSERNSTFTSRGRPSKTVKLLERLFQGCVDGDVEAIRQVVAEDDSILEATNDKTRSPLMVAVLFGHAEAAHELIRLRAAAIIQRAEKNNEKLKTPSEIRNNTEFMSSRRGEDDDDYSDYSGEGIEEETSAMPSVVVDAQQVLRRDLGDWCLRQNHEHFMDTRLTPWLRNAVAAVSKKNHESQGIKFGSISTNFGLWSPLQLAVLRGDVAIVRGILSALEAVAPSVLLDVARYRDATFVASYLNQHELVCIAIARDDLAMLAMLMEFGITFDEFEFRSGMNMSFNSENGKTSNAGMRRSLLFPRPDQSSSFGNSTIATGADLTFPAVPRREQLIHVAAFFGARKCYKNLVSLEKSELGVAVRSFIERNENFQRLKAELQGQFPGIVEGYFKGDWFRLVVESFIGRGHESKTPAGLGSVSVAVLTNRIHQLGDLIPNEQLYPSPSKFPVCLVSVLELAGTSSHSIGAEGSALALAVSTNQPRLVEYLIDERKMDPNVPEVTLGGHSLVSLACYCRLYDMVGLLAKRVEFSTLTRANDHGLTPMMIAAGNKDLGRFLAAVGDSAARRLLTRSEIVDAKDNSGHSLVHIVMRAAEVSSCCRLLDAVGDDSVIGLEASSTGQTPLDYLRTVVLTSIASSDHQKYRLGVAEQRVVYAEARNRGGLGSRSLCALDDVRNTLHRLLGAVKAETKTKQVRQWLEYFGLPHKPRLRILKDPLGESDPVLKIARSDPHLSGDELLVLTIKKIAKRDGSCARYIWL